ncbi:uridine kinase family protein [Saccharomonospora viridis]|uniref:Uridine kinase n=1 Tax=Saccharomonospora viridis (strain ATCC 15386 / DSM 43017 / JCM 3036 / CCUG 5913 / NBRC 12207 / NCIMB 9602 / P101) TaxID=471857 RepID=C7MR20_SACVD|nr:(d)CMP kinase [Saccharomonospora viridis]ACU98606.1 uridine kinase [Saccharomonospora viridis DSM 43017]
MPSDLASGYEPRHVPVDGVADAVLAAPPRLGAVRLVAVDGPSGSGKSTFARELTATLRDRGVRTELISTDDFATWDDPVSWWPRLAEVLDRIAAGLPGRYRAWDWSTGRPRPGAEVRVAVPEVLVVEGVSAGRASVRPRLSRLCWVEVPCPEERLRRAVARDGEASRPMLEAWQRFERGWFAVDQTKRHADDVILPADV